jgi:hypothetical protein
MHHCVFLTPAYYYKAVVAAAGMQQQCSSNTASPVSNETPTSYKAIMVQLPTAIAAHK